MLYCCCTVAFGYDMLNDSPQPHCSATKVVSGRFVSVLDEVLTDIRILEDESRTKLILEPVHFTSDDAEQRLTIYQDLDAVLFHGLIECSRFVHVFQMVCQSTTPSIFHAYPDEFALWLFK